MPYLDHAATTPLRPEVLAVMTPWLTSEFGNPSSAHGPGRRARVAVEQAREKVAAVLQCEPAEVVFTSGGTESNTAAIMGVLGADAVNGARRGSIVTTASEHLAILDPLIALHRRGQNVAFLAPDSEGLLCLDALTSAVSTDTALVSAIWVNNETGAVSPIVEAARISHEAGALFHTDAVQAAGHVPIDLATTEVDLLTLSGHKLGGPKGTGVLFVRAGTPWAPLFRGGAQERGRRAGTENVAGIVGLAEAVRLAEAEREEVAARLHRLRKRLLEVLLQELGEWMHIHTPTSGEDGVGAQSSAHILSVSFTGRAGGPLDGEMLLLGLDVEGVHVSAGSACTSGALESSHVLRAMGVSDDIAAATVRFSLGRATTPADIDAAAESTVRVVRRMTS